MGSPTCTTLLEAVVRPVRAIAGSVSRSPGPRELGPRARGCRMALIALAVLALQPLAAGAHETDQCTLPLGRELADLKVALSRIVQGAIVEAVDKTNAAIKRSLWHGEPTERTAQLQSADWIAAQVWTQLFAAFPTNEGLDIVLAGEAMRARYPGAGHSLPAGAAHLRRSAAAAGCNQAHQNAVPQPPRSTSTGRCSAPTRSSTSSTSGASTIPATSARASAGWARPRRSPARSSSRPAPIHFCPRTAFSAC